MQQLATANAGVANRGIEINHLHLLVARRTEAQYRFVAALPDNQNFVPFGRDQNFLCFKVHLIYNRLSDKTFIPASDSIASAGSRLATTNFRPCLSL